MRRRSSLRTRLAVRGSRARPSDEGARYALGGRSSTAIAVSSRRATCSWRLASSLLNLLSDHRPVFVGLICNTLASSRSTSVAMARLILESERALHVDAEATPGGSDSAAGSFG